MAIICVIEIRGSFFSHDMGNILCDYDSLLYNVSEKKILLRTLSIWFLLDHNITLGAFN